MWRDDRGGKPITILMADDDEEDRDLTREALVRAHLSNEVRFVGDGQELLDYLRHEGRYSENSGADGRGGAGGGGDSAPVPGIILLDLNMPKKDGREALEEIKTDPRLRTIPVVVLTTSRDEEDVIRSYDLGVSSFITKPVTFGSLVEVMGAWGRYWFEIVELPGEGAVHD